MKDDKVKIEYIYVCTSGCAHQCNNKEYLLDTGELVKGSYMLDRKFKDTQEERCIGEGVFHKKVEG